ncbi:MAG TPA: nitroreductase [Muricauda sp.]|uniref:Nitroreductase family protein n=1 Tax=Flagellimonas aurea TaxID=2915619 RepID=A0ABS3G245_9FLAO|nr:nitroreductase family protein [Allomuricauda aurea]MBO0353481.1 nitroreductase family protein [Allomuricauda aurea]HBU79562.1 nitroreductase [Allomuricauda sp.]|tara:strand:- start:1031 stop:1639 length:609 start_codon:yes stop_codon:yes gene_type:complete
MKKELEQVRLGNIADTDYEIFALLKQRYSPRTFRDEKIKKGQLNQLFEAARWSASSNNLQPWRFIYAEKGSEAFDKIVNCLSDFNKKWAPEAPLLMLAIYKEKTNDGKENFHALHDLGLCLGNMSVQAQYLDIALHHMAGVDWKKAQKEFNVPDGYHISSAIAVGYYGGELDKLPKKLQESELAGRQRVPQEDFAFKEVWES